MEHFQRILICDDDLVIAQEMRDILAIGNYYQIQITNSSRHALRLMQQSLPDLVILDTRIPELSDLQLSEVLKKYLVDTSFIFVTDTSLDASILEAIRTGTCDFLKVPYAPEELQLRVAKVLLQRHLNRGMKDMEVDKKLLESQLHHAQKMEAIGSMAGGIAHDFNNVLNIIMGNAELGMQYLPRTHRALPHLEQVNTASMRAREMIRQLMNFSRKEDTELLPVSLNRVVSDSLKLMRATMPANITIGTDICSADCISITDATRIHQIIFNLCINSAHAMETKGGTLSVSLNPAAISMHAGNKLGIKPGKYNQLVVMDNGSGIEKAILDRIFEPYFTTKEPGKGTGMGLALVQDIVKKCGGAIRAYSIPDLSTEFHLYFPCCSAKAVSESSSHIRRNLPRGQESVLLVDDEVMLTQMLKGLLEQLGYSVTPFVNSRDAYNAFRANPDTFDLLVCGTMMPEMTGMKLIREVIRLRSNFPSILLTGYSKKASQINTSDLGACLLLPKPVSLEDVANAVREVLNKPADLTQNHLIANLPFIRPS